ncbi:MAG: metallophosphoesterase [Chloroflexi bacterium]|nr:metallophosphoesterase [Chloroflexota bacterium]
MKLSVAALGVYTVGIEPNRLVTRRQDIFIHDLPPALNGLNIGMLCDLHYSPVMPRFRVERAIATLATEKPDIVVMPGDFVSYWSEYAAKYAEILAPLNPPFGVFACTGNHEHWTDPDGVAAALRDAGITVLRNQHQLVSIGDAQLCVIGIDDIGATNSPLHHDVPADDLPAALDSSPITGVTRLLLVHDPTFVTTPAFAAQTARHPIHLVLSGHTHGGQVRLPLIGAPQLLYWPGARLFDNWLAQVGETQVYVSRGAGESWPLRFNCPPEVNILTLRAAQAQKS